MSHFILIYLGILSIFSLASSLTVLASAPPIVNTTHGPVRGEAFVLNTNKTLVRYLGIPFAHANRFEAPESPTPWKTTLNTTSFGKSCPQNPNVVVNSTKNTDENCLTINVFVPQDNVKQSALLPVMVWIYGGGFSVGSSAFSSYNGAYLATEGGVMVVTFNYRLGVLGFLSTGTEDIPGNFGLLDQVKALHWVHENIERFGGDPKKVTIFGQSAGAASVALHMLSPLSYGLYHKVILQSGTAAATFAGTDNKTATELARALAGHVGCSMSGLKDCLLSKNVSEILKAQKNITSNDVFLPVVDYHFLHDHPFNLLVNGKFNQTVPAMIGVTKNEGGFFVLHIEGISPGVPGIDKGLNKTAFDSLVKRGRHWVYNQTQKVVDSVIFEYTDWTNATNLLVLRQKYMDVITDASFKAPAVRSAQVFVKNNIKETYFYCFDHLVSKLFPSWSGVVHGADLVYVFGRPFLKYNKNASEADQDVEIKFSKQIISMWSNFTKNGQPTADVNAANWPVYTLKDEQYMSLSPSSSIQKNMLPEKMAFWNSLVPALTETQPTKAPIVPPTTKPSPAPVTISPTGEKEAITDKKTENALIGVVVVLVVAVLVLVFVIWRIRRKLGDALSDPGPTTRLI
ncbi:hypothetical protein OS493_037056 [Desmophyllum pertusum]|uniref:Carboxylic ester hydrolase n=1 Tax=Desmophyllum pertusum TaxID=174260 RepID=A0A9W9ZX14_9CNID|nr:hypothetical protein OS493_037056 [Desmophyllum pertusum]